MNDSVIQPGELRRFPDETKLVFRGNFEGF